MKNDSIFFWVLFRYKYRHKSNIYWHLFSAKLMRSYAPNHPPTRKIHESPLAGAGNHFSSTTNVIAVSDVKAILTEWRCRVPWTVFRCFKRFGMNRRLLTYVAIPGWWWRVIRRIDVMSAAQNKCLKIGPLTLTIRMESISLGDSIWRQGQLIAMPIII